MVITINKDWCKKCGICVYVCPKDVYSFNDLEGPRVEKEDRCIGCDQCVLMCPDMAIKVEQQERRT